MKKKESLKKHTSFQIGGFADYFIAFSDKEELAQGIELAKRKKLPFLVLGGGSNILFPDDNYRGIVLKDEMKKVEIKKENRVFSETGVALSKVLSLCLNHGLSGLEWAAGIPGTIGGSVRGNAGAFGKSMKDSVISVNVYETGSRKTLVLKNKDCRFGYRESVFKKNPNYIILSVEMKFKKTDVSSINKEIKFYLKQRKEKQPHGFSAGSIFKNYEIKNEEEKEKIINRHPEIKKIIKDDMIPAAFLIDQCGLKGKISGKAMISRVHANFIVNLGQAKANDVKNLMMKIQKEVEKKYGIVLEKEIMVINT